MIQTLTTKIILCHKYEDIINVENILEAWREFLSGKRNKPGVQEFSLRLMDNIFNLHYDLFNYTYKHGIYQQFKINDPKPRIIHKASVRDRLMHHAVYRKLYPFFDKKFIPDSYSCRNEKGTHKALNQFKKYVGVVSKNNTKQCWILKCDIKKFFANIDHDILISILKEHIADKRIIWLLREIITSFNKDVGTGLPLGNLTSQLFANIYMNKLDQFIKRNIKVKYYIRYSDDFIFLFQDRQQLKNIIPQVKQFLDSSLGLGIHQNKTSIKTIFSGQDFLGWINFEDHRILRTSTKRRMLKRIKQNPSPETFNSYLGLVSHGNETKIKQILELLVNYNY